jgi:hypothetical protein
MRLIWGGCESRQAAYLLGADRLGARERVALEAHAATCAECADALRNGRPVDAALRRAFMPLRERRTVIAPGRVRMAVGPRTAAPASPWLRAPRFFGRLAEVSVMLGVTIFAVGSSLDSSTRDASSITTRSVVQEYFRAQPPIGDIDYARWLRLVKADASSTVSDSKRLPSGGRFDYDPVDTAKVLGISPR